MKPMVVQFACESLPIGSFCFIETIQSDVVGSEGKVRGGIVRIQTKCLPALFSPFLILPNDRVNCPRQEIMRHLRARIGLYPKLAGLFGLFHVPGDHLMEKSRDKILFCFTGSVAEFVCLSGVIGSEAGFSNFLVHEAQPCVREGKIWVEFDSMLIKRNRYGRPCSDPHFAARAESFKGFERWRSGLF